MLLILRGLERIILSRNPNLAQITGDLVSPPLPLINHCEFLAKFLDLFLDAILLARGTDAHKFVLIRLLAKAERERI